MPTKVLDFRSDTLTQPTQEMRQAMVQADVGDDVFGEDPSVLRLQERIAEILGKEAALFVPSGTMSNLIAIRLHCNGGDELICESRSHIFNYEQAGHAQIWGVSSRSIKGSAGIIGPEQIQDIARGENDHFVHTRLFCLENTHNMAGGRILPLENTQALCQSAHRQGLATHMDGARLFNAVVATGIKASSWAKEFDTVSICFSKGLGAPVGSALCGTKEAIARARRYRKVLGGGMRQAGMIAAAAQYALEHHVQRLEEDHIAAKQLAKHVADTPGLELVSPTIDTNILVFKVSPTIGTASDFTNHLMRKNIRMLAIGSQLVRAVTHLDVVLDDIEVAGKSLAQVAGDFRLQSRSD